MRAPSKGLLKQPAEFPRVLIQVGLGMRFQPPLQTSMFLRKRTIGLLVSNREICIVAMA